MQLLLFHSFFIWKRKCISTFSKNCMDLRIAWWASAYFQWEAQIQQQVQNNMSIFALLLLLLLFLAMVQIRLLTLKKIDYKSDNFIQWKKKGMKKASALIQRKTTTTENPNLILSVLPSLFSLPFFDNKKKSISSNEIFYIRDFLSIFRIKSQPKFHSIRNTFSHSVI